MSRTLLRRAGTIGVVAAALVAGSACDVVRVGSRCTPGAAPGRDSTHLVLCQNGRWTRSITLQETARALASFLPSTVTVVTGADQTALPTANFGAPIVLKVTDSHGTPIAGVVPKLTSPDVMVSGVPSSGTYTTPTATGADGLSTFTVKAPAKAGDARFTAVVNDATAPTGVTFALKVKPDAPATVDITAQDDTQSAKVATAFARPLTVTVLDQYRNPVPGKTVTYTVAPADGGAAATLSASTAVTAANGAASVTATANGVAGSYNVFVTVQDFPQQSSIEFNLTNTP